MYHLAVIVFLALALFKLVDVLEDLLPGITRLHTWVTLGLGIVAVYALDYSMFAGWRIEFRQHWMGTLATGFVLFGMTSVWRAVFHWLGSTEGDAPEARHPLHGPRSMAA